MKSLEKNEDVLRQDPHTGLGELAQGTGGQIFENTNSLQQGFERLDSDLRNYYLVGYTPANATYDGKFRSIDVKVKRPGVTVSARKGYFAVRDTGGAPVNPWEAPALAALDRRPVPNAFPIRAGALSFPSWEHPGMVPVVVDLKTAPMSFPTAEDQKSFKSDFAVVVRFLGPKNEVVKKVGQHYEMAGELDKLEHREEQRGALLPRAGTAAGRLHDGDDCLRQSVRQGERALRDGRSAEDRDGQAPDEQPRHREEGARRCRRASRRTGPLFVKDVLIYPEPGRRHQQGGQGIRLLLHRVPGRGRARAAGAPGTDPERQAAGAGAPAARGGGRLGADPAGGPASASRSFRPGTYELRVIVKQGTEQVFRSAMVHVAD